MAGALSGLIDTVKQRIAPERVTLTFSQKKAEHLSDTCGLVAGAGVADITPRPGVPKGGYAAISNFGNGFRTRLRVRSFYIHHEGGEPVVIVQADLHAGSSIIRDKVAERVAAYTNIESNNICMTCTHTHAGPGQLLDSDFYNAFASNKPGLDVELYEYIVDKVVESVLAAYEDRKPAKLATGKVDIWHATRNRSLDPFLQNPGKSDRTNIYDAINPFLYMIRIDQQGSDGAFYPRAAISSFSIHGTSIPVTEKSNNADVWAYISAGVEDKVKARAAAPWGVLHGAFQGTHGDIAPNIKEGRAGFIESRRLGEQIGGKAWSLFESLEVSLSSDVTLGSAIREVDFFEEAIKAPGSIARRPIVGTALTAGAFENETPILYHAPLFKHGSSSARLVLNNGEQGHKRWVGSYFQMLALPKREFPHCRQLQILSVGDFVMLALPFEVSVEAGARIVGAVEGVLASSHASPGEIFVTSLANGYTGYTVTPEEYTRQFYEGGHTLYGPKTTPFLAGHMASLAEDLAIKGNVCDLPEQKILTFKTCQYFKGEKPDMALAARSVRAPQFRPASDNQEPCWEFVFSDRPPSQMDFSLPMVKIEVLGDDGWAALEVGGVLVDDQGVDVGLFQLEGANPLLYRAAWYNPALASVNGVTKSYRFVYTDHVHGRVLCSSEFQLPLD